MCQVFAGQDPDEYASETRSMRLSGYSTSVRLETAFWRVLDDIALREGITVPQFCSKLHDEVTGLQGEVRNFSSLLRCACLVHLRREAAEAAGVSVAAE
ncbi:MAG: ribbon-helix-helix domain-containing protein [Pseudomonadota bacterium]